MDQFTDIQDLTILLRHSPPDMCAWSEWDVDDETVL